MKLLWIWLPVLSCLSCCCSASGKKAASKSTVALWPLPKHFSKVSKTVLAIKPYEFRFRATGKFCSLLEDAFRRHYELLFKDQRYQERFLGAYRSLLRRNGQDESFKFLEELQVHLETPCEKIPHDAMDENYEIQINTDSFPGQGCLFAASIWGILRGLETFTQLVHYDRESGYTYCVESVLIQDSPRFPHRGILLDTSRHFIPVRDILQQLNLMAHHKMNAFHWHLTDDPAFPFKSYTFSNLSIYGAYHPLSHIYDASDVKRILYHASSLGIRVIPEFDVPGHTKSWGKGYPDLLTTCYKDGRPDGTKGPMNPASDYVYTFLQSFFEEVSQKFPDQMVHIGGDEVQFGCWSSNPEVREFLQKKFNSSDPKLAQDYFVERIGKITLDLGRKPVVWQEVLDTEGITLKDLIVQVWKNNNYEDELISVVKAGHKALLSACWYLDHILYGIDWHKYYECDPHPEGIPEKLKSQVLGGEACMWTEYVDRTNLMPILWPRASTVAERLWSPKEVRDLEDAERRLEEHRCRLLRWGYEVAPINGPGFCL